MNSITKQFKTRSEIIDRKMPSLEGHTVVALDVGYSSVKGSGPSRIFSFPSYAKKAPSDLEVVGKVRPEDILYKNNATGETWLVGQAAESLMDQADLDSTTDASLYTRYRYDSDVFKVIMSTGLALCLWGTPENNAVHLQTGLPAAYKDRDTPALTDALVGHYDISVKVGQGPWTNFDFSLAPEDVSVMEQPQGTLCAVAYKDGKVSEEGRKILSSNSLINDVGFGTEDHFSIRNGYKNSHRTYSDTGMKSVFEEVVKRIKNADPGAPDFKVFELQNYLESGKATYFDQGAFKQVLVDFEKYLTAANEELCEKSIMRMMQEYQNLQSYDNLIITGGTGESRFEQIKTRLAVIPTLSVIPGNVNTPDLPCIYSNVVGYHMFRYAATKKEIG